MTISNLQNYIFKTAKYFTIDNQLVTNHEVLSKANPEGLNAVKPSRTRVKLDFIKNTHSSSKELLDQVYAEDIFEKSILSAKK